MRTTGLPAQVLASVLQMLNCIGAGLTLGATDTLRVFSHDFIPNHLMVEHPSVCTQCSTAPVDGCDECERIKELLNNVELVTRKLFNVCARASFNPSTSHSDHATVELLHEVRYNQEIYRPTSAMRATTSSETK